MHKVIFSKKAEREYEEIGAFIAEDNPFYALEVLEKIDKSIDVLTEFPYIGRKIQQGLYMIVEPRYRFKIIYQLQSASIRIVSVFKYKNTWE